MRLTVVVFILAATAFRGAESKADETMIPLAANGAWIAMAHHPSMTAPPDVCLAANQQGGLAFRADENGVEMRIGNSSWSLPSAVEGQVTATVGSWTQSFDIDGNTSDLVNVPIPDNLIQEMFAAMDKSTVMTIVVGKAKPISISLSGSTKVTNAFRTCANIGNSGPGGGENPFK